MALEYAKVLRDLKAEIIAVGRDAERANTFQRQTGIETSSGGIEKWLQSGTELPKRAIVAASEIELGKATHALIRAGVKSILVEKPGGLDVADIKSVAEEAKKYGADVRVGYNRRCYASTAKAQKIISEDGGVESFNFEFTEWIHKIPEAKKNSATGREWLLVNSTHIIDLAFFLGGFPKKMSCFASGSLPWHPAGSIFSGSGISETGALFSYQANWQSPGRWSVEMLTKKHRLIFRPLEKLQIQNLCSVAIEEVPIEDRLDTNFKPGLYKQVELFIKNPNTLLGIAQQADILPFYELIKSGGSIQ